MNAADNSVRDPNMKEIKIQINPEEGWVSVRNDGKGIPVVIHKEHNLWVPEMIFGHLLTSSNYNDEEKKVTGGRNGYGAKLTNIYSSQFTLETADGNNRFSMTWRNNMSESTKPNIKS